MEGNVFDKREVLTFFRNKEGKIISRLPNGKYVFLNRGEREDNLELGIPYECLVKELESYAFAKLVNRVFLPQIILNGDRLIYLDKSNDNKVFKDINYSEIEGIIKNNNKVLIINRNKE